MGDAYEAYEEAAEIRMAAAEVRALLLPPKIMWVDKVGKKHDPLKMNIPHLKNCVALCKKRGAENIHRELNKVLQARLEDFDLIDDGESHE